MVEAQNWEIALKLYEGHPLSALTLAYQLIALKQCLERALDGTVIGMTERYDIHNVAREAARIREQLESLNKTGVKMVRQVGGDNKDTTNLAL